MNSLSVIIIIAVLLIVVLAMISNRHQKNKYDERQILLRNRGYKYAFWTVIILDFILFLLVTSFNLKINAEFLLLAPIMVGIFVFAVYSLFKGAYIAYNAKNLVLNAILFAVIGIMYLYISIKDFLAPYTEWEINTIFLMSGIFFLIIGVGYLYQYIS